MRYINAHRLDYYLDLTTASISSADAASAFCLTIAEKYTWRPSF